MLMLDADVQRLTVVCRFTYGPTTKCPKTSLGSEKYLVVTRTEIEDVASNTSTLNPNGFQKHKPLNPKP